MYNIKLPHAPKKIVVMNMASLGDTLLGTPVLKNLREHYPQSRIVFVVSPKAQYIADGHPYIDDYALYDKGYPIGPVVQKCWRADLAIILDSRYRSGFLMWLSGIPVRIKCGGGKLNFYTHQTDKDHQPDIPEIDTYMETLRLLGINQIADRLYTAPATEDEVRRVDTLLEGIGEYVVFSPFSLSKFKDWPTENYNALTIRLKEKDKTAVLIGAPADRERGEEIPAAINLIGETNIREAREIIRRSSLFISGGTFNLHLCDTTETPSIALYGHYNGRPEAFIPKRNCCLLCMPKKCSGACNTTQICPDDLLCMYSISVDIVWDTIGKKLNIYSS